MFARTDDVLRALKKGAEWVAVSLFTALFGTFLLQIFTRYVLNNPLGWTLELCLAAWLWVVFWSAAFLVREQQHVAFNIFYLGATPPVRRIFALAGAVSLLAAFLIAFPPTWDFIAFMKIDSTPVLKIRFDVLFVVFAVFMAAVIVRSIVRIRRLLSPDWETETEDVGSGSL